MLTQHGVVVADHEALQKQADRGSSRVVSEIEAQREAAVGGLAAGFG